MVRPSKRQRAAMLLTLACVAFAPSTSAGDSFDLPDARVVPTTSCCPKIAPTDAGARNIA